MHLQLEKLVLRTQNIAIMAQFITQLFDIQINVDSNDKKYFIFGEIPIYLENCKLEKEKLSSNVALNFKVKDFSILENFQFKLQFYDYREGFESNTTLENSSHSGILKFIDPDGRPWLIESPSQVFSQTSI